MKIIKVFGPTPRKSFNLRSFAMLAVCVVTFIVAASCSDKENTNTEEPLPKEEDIVQMYGHYINREYAVYVDQMESLDHKPESYRSQTIDLMKQLRHKQDSLNGGPISCRVTKLEPSKDGRYCSAFLEVTNRDRTFEQILLPLVLKDEVWRLK